MFTDERTRRSERGILWATALLVLAMALQGCHDSVVSDVEIDDGNASDILVGNLIVSTEASTLAPTTASSSQPEHVSTGHAHDRIPEATRGTSLANEEHLHPEASHRPAEDNQKSQAVRFALDARAQFHDRPACPSRLGGTNASETTTAAPGKCEFGVEPMITYEWDPACLHEASLGCFADGISCECRFCGGDLYPPCEADLTGVSQTASTTAAPTEDGSSQRTTQSLGTGSQDPDEQHVQRGAPSQTEEEESGGSHQPDGDGRTPSENTTSSDTDEAESLPPRAGDQDSRPGSSSNTSSNPSPISHVQPRTSTTSAATSVAETDTVSALDHASTSVSPTMSTSLDGGAGSKSSAFLSKSTTVAIHAASTAPSTSYRQDAVHHNDILTTEESGAWRQGGGVSRQVAATMLLSLAISLGASRMAGF